MADRSRGDDPWLLITGDSLLVGDVARPDLAYEPTEGAQALHATLRELLDLGDHVEIWPAHVGGSLCGGAGLSMKTSSTIGYERLHNSALSMDQSGFVDGVIASLPCRPPNIERIVGLNRRAGGRVPAEPVTLQPASLAELFAADVTVLDSRSPADFDAGHLPGSINLPVASAGFGTRAGWALDPDQALVIVAADAAAIRATTSRLQAVGFWSLSGASVADPIAWEQAGLIGRRIRRLGPRSPRPRPARGRRRARRRPRADRMGRGSRRRLPPRPPEPSARRRLGARPRLPAGPPRSPVPPASAPPSRPASCAAPAATTSSASPVAASRTCPAAGSSWRSATERPAAGWCLELEANVSCSAPPTGALLCTPARAAISTGV